jgi:hypothetical protein
VLVVGLTACTIQRDSNHETAQTSLQEVTMLGMPTSAPPYAPSQMAEGKANQQAAWTKYHTLLASRQPVSADCTVRDLAARFLAHHETSSARFTWR